MTVEVYGFDEEPTSEFTTFAGNGSWDVLGGEPWVMSGIMSRWEVDGIYRSTGGDFGLSIPPHEKYFQTSGKVAGIQIQLWEADPDPNPDDYVAQIDIQGPIVQPNFIIAFRNNDDKLNDFVDGGNRRAEFYTKLASTYTVYDQTLWVQYYD